MLIKIDGTGPAEKRLQSHNVDSNHPYPEFYWPPALSDAYRAGIDRIFGEKRHVDGRKTKKTYKI